MRRFATELDTARIRRLEDMRRFATELDTARIRREEDWNRIRNDSNNALREFSESRKISAAQFRNDLIAYHHEMRVQTREQLISMHQERQRMKETQLASLRQWNLALKKDVAEEIRQIGEHRVETTAEMRAALSEYRSQAIKEVTEMLAASHHARMELRQHFNDIHQEWVGRGSEQSDTSRSNSPPSGKASSENDQTVKVEAEPEIGMEGIDMEERILRVIKKAPEGVNITNIANMLGIPWRKATHPAQKLVVKGLVHKEGGIYHLS